VLGEPILVRLSAEATDHFDASSFERFYSAQDQYGYAAVGFTLRKSRRDDFARVTEAHLSQRLCIVLDNKVRSAPSLNTKLVDGGIIEGRFSDEEAKRLADGLTKVEGPLRIVETR
jgi:preprotein translocase subunit SecD